LTLRVAGAQVGFMTGDSRGKGKLGRRRGRGVTLLFALVLGGCAVSFEDADGRRQIVGLFSLESEDAASAASAAGTVRHFAFYGLWVDDALRGTSMALGEVELTIADLRNQWAHISRVSQLEQVPEDSCSGGFGFQWCSLAPPTDRAGALFDIAVAGVSIGVGARDRHFGVGYHRQTLMEATDENALVAWPALPKALADTPAQASVQVLLRGSFNG
jgi:hypothetical protein